MTKLEAVAKFCGWKSLRRYQDEWRYGITTNHSIWRTSDNDLLALLKKTLRKKGYFFDIKYGKYGSRKTAFYVFIWRWDKALNQPTCHGKTELAAVMSAISELVEDGK
jgi:hypothetical protein